MNGPYKKGTPVIIEGMRFATIDYDNFDNGESIECEIVLCPEVILRNRILKLLNKRYKKVESKGDLIA